MSGSLLFDEPMFTFLLQLKNKNCIEITGTQRKLIFQYSSNKKGRLHLLLCGMLTTFLDEKSHTSEILLKNRK